jgi:hypothetical protein
MDLIINDNYKIIFFLCVFLCRFALKPSTIPFKCLQSTDRHLKAVKGCLVPFCTYGIIVKSNTKSDIFFEEKIM